VISIAQPLLGEAEIHAVAEVLRSGHLAQGSRVQEFEERFAAMCGVRYAIATSSGTAALHTALLAHDIGPGDEVITTPFSFIASANAVLYTGARPVFADIDPLYLHIDPEQVEAKITARTRAILLVHLYGQACDMDAITDIAERYSLVIIEDACQAHGAMFHGRCVGCFGTGCFSFYATKNITTAEGGIVTTNDPHIAERARMIRNHGMRQRYYHEVLGYNFRMTDVQAAIGMVQMEHLEGWNRHRMANAEFLSAHLAGVRIPAVRPHCVHVFHQYVVGVASDRDRLAQRLQEAGIGTAVHYPAIIPHQPLYQQLGYKGEWPQAEFASRQVLSLPVHPGLSRMDLECIVQEVSRWC
jgi:dTDP-4-amino-4,6-dideoxygalactose transaminase